MLRVSDRGNDLKKRAISASVTMLLFTACFRAAAETPPSAILQCVGSMTSEGINAPKDVLLDKPSDVVGTYTLQGNVLIESGGGTYADEHYGLCSTTSTTYVYSTDCSVGRMRYITDWLAVKDGLANERFEAKHKDSATTLDIVVIDRVNLSIHSESLGTQFRTDINQKTNAVTLTPFLTSARFAGSCSIVKPKL